jgi:hypothetical protein
MWKVAKVKLNWKWLHKTAREWLVLILCAAKRSTGCSRLPDEMWEMILQLAVQYNFSNYGMDPIKLCARGFGLDGMNINMAGSHVIHRSGWKGWAPNDIDLFVHRPDLNGILKRIFSQLNVPKHYATNNYFQGLDNTTTETVFGNIRPNKSVRITIHGFDLNILILGDIIFGDFMHYDLWECGHHYSFYINKWKTPENHIIDALPSFDSWRFNYVSNMKLMHEAISNYCEDDLSYQEICVKVVWYSDRQQMRLQRYKDRAKACGVELKVHDYKEMSISNRMAVRNLMRYSMTYTTDEDDHLVY